MSENSPELNTCNSIQKILDYLDINNNILVENPESITKLAIEIKKKLKSEYSEQLAQRFDKIFQNMSIYLSKFYQKSTLNMPKSEIKIIS